MRVGLHTPDKPTPISKKRKRDVFPNLALMKLSAWHKARGDSVGWFKGIEGFIPADPGPFDLIYSSRVFTYSEADPDLPPTARCGGFGYGYTEWLPDEIEHICPDYDLYKTKSSFGFLTRGCDRKCSFCFVPEKEGKLRAHADIEEFLRHDSVIIMDNNILASDHGIAQIEKIAKLGVKVDFNQGLDARFIDDSMARLLAKVKWLEPLRIACDSQSQIKYAVKAVANLRWNNVTPARYCCYMLVKDIEEALERLKVLKTLYVDPHAQPYIDREGTPPTKLQAHFARWVNFKPALKSMSWEEYKESRYHGE